MLALGILIGLALAFALAVYCRRKPDSAVAGVVETVLAASSGGPGVPRK